MLTCRLPSGGVIHLWIWNQASVHGISSQRFMWGKEEEEERRFGGESHGCSFLVLRWCYSHGLPWTWDHHQLKVLHCNTHTLKQWLRAVRKHKNNILLQSDNLRPQTAMEAIEQLDLAISPHLLYSPHLVPCNFQLFFQKWIKDCQDLDQETKCGDLWWQVWETGTGLLLEVCGEWW